MGPVYYVSPSNFVEEEEAFEAAAVAALELVAPAERWLWIHFQSFSNFCHTLVSGIVTEVATPSLHISTTTTTIIIIIILIPIIIAILNNNNLYILCVSNDDNGMFHE